MPPFRALIGLGLAALIGLSAASGRGGGSGKGPPDGASYLFLDSLANWVRRADGSPAPWPVEDEVTTARGGDLVSRPRFRDFVLHVEFSVPYLPDADGPDRGNSGIYLQGLYEVQVVDSHGRRPTETTCGAIVGQVAPASDATRPPLQWQAFDITSRSARVEGDLTRKARVTVVLNGTTIVDDREVGPTPGHLERQGVADAGPIVLQDRGDAVQYRNIWIKPLD